MLFISLSVSLNAAEKNAPAPTVHCDAAAGVGICLGVVTAGAPRPDVPKIDLDELPSGHEPPPALKRTDRSHAVGAVKGLASLLQSRTPNTSTDDDGGI